MLENTITPSAVLSKLQTETTDAHSLALSLLESGLNDGGFEKSLSNCHQKAMDSVVLFDGTDKGQGMIRFFFARPGNPNLTDLYTPEGHFGGGIHNHHYDLAIIPLIGNPINVETERTFKKTNSSIELHEYGFTSGLPGGEIATLYKAPRVMRPLEHIQLAPGDVRLMKAADLHTMIIPDEHNLPGVAWMVIEGSPQPTDSLIYSPRTDLVISSKGLYAPMSRDKAITVTETIFELAKKG